MGVAVAQLVNQDVLTLNQPLDFRSNILLRSSFCLSLLFTDQTNAAGKNTIFACRLVKSQVKVFMKLLSPQHLIQFTRQSQFVTSPAVFVFQFALSSLIRSQVSLSYTETGFGPNVEVVGPDLSEYLLKHLLFLKCAWWVF